MDLTGLADEELALQLKNGAEEAFNELVRRHQGRIYAVAYRMTSNRDDALDVTQEVFVKAYRNIRKWSPSGRFVPWLMRLTTNQSIDHLRRNKRHRHDSLDALYSGRVPGDSPADGLSGPERDAGAREIDERVQAALDALSPSQRTVFVLRHYDGMQLAEIATVMGCTVGSVKVHLFRALKKLQGELRDLYAEHGSAEG